MQPDLPPLSRGRRPGPARENDPRDDGAVSATRWSRTTIPTVDITGGAPGAQPDFRWLVAGRALGRHVIDRCNLTVLSSPSQRDLAEFLADTRSRSLLAAVLPRA